MRADVLEVISSAKDVTNAVILTHNIDFVFVQTVVLSAFRRCGHPTITVFADSGCAAESFAHQKGVLTSLGVRYRVVPVEMDPGFRFHPKAVLLSGEQAATLLVGSGNLTFGGWRENGEVWTRFESGSDGAAPFLAFRRYLTDVIERVALPESVEAEIEEAFDRRSKSWLSMEGTDANTLVGRVGSGSALLDRMLDASGGDPVDEFLVCAPYFDDEGIALRELVARVGANRTTVLCQAGRSTLQERAWRPTAARARLRSIDFSRPVTGGEERSAFVHAKFYGLRRENEVVVLAGSANCSRAALTVEGRAGNAELMAVQVMTPQAFEEELLGELKLSSAPIVLADRPSNDVDEGSGGIAVRVLAARFEAGCLLVGYSPPAAAITECLVDGTAADFVSVEKGVVSVSCATEPKVVMVRARVAGELVASDPAWVDLERQLRATAHGRSLADSFRARVQPGLWSAGGWAEVLDVFCKHLSYMPTVRPSVSERRPGGGATSVKQPEFTAADVFATGYRAPKLGPLWFPAGGSEDGHVQSLQQLLLRWFGAEQQEPNDEAGIDDDNDPDDDEVVDRPESLSATTTDAVPSERDRRRIARLFDQIQAAMTSSEFLSERGPEYLATDLKLASALLCLGLRKGWVERERFFDLTQGIWSSLFFSSAPQKEVGWLEFRAGTSADRETFINNMRSEELSAALIGWYLAVPTNCEESPTAARFELAAVLAVARLPWLWQGGNQDEIAKELAVLLAHTADLGLTQKEIKSRTEAEWELLMQRGQALRCLEAAVSGMTPAVIRERIGIEELRPGDLLWQGKAGFCVVRRGCSRTTDEIATVLKLQGDGLETGFKASYTVPMRALLEEVVVPRTRDFGDRPRLVLREFIRELSTASVGGREGAEPGRV